MVKKGIYIILTILIYFIYSFSQEIKKPFVLQHIFHKHKIDFTNALVLQQIDNYTAIYNTTHILGRFSLTDRDFIFVNLSKTFGNGVNSKLEKNGFSISTTGDDLEDYLNDINETGRKYLLELFYQRDIENLTLTVGLIDSTAFIDANEYANDEHTQFLNSAFVNNPLALLPSYNLGIALTWNFNDSLGTTIVYMDTNPDRGNVGILEFEIKKENFNLRPYYFYLFNYNEYKGFGLSADYKMSDKYGLFSRIGNSTGDYNYFLSGGFQIQNILIHDKFGLAYGFIKARENLKNIYIFESYYLINIFKNLSITFDIQHMKENKSKFIYGIRTYFYF
jgi:hypothetical protein